MKLFGNGLIGLGARLVHINHAGIGLVTGGNGGRGGSGVGCEAAGVIGDSGTGHIEVHEVQGLGAVEHGTLAVSLGDAGLGLHIIGIGHGAQIVGSSLELGIAHTVTDEQKHILGVLCGAVDGSILHHGSLHGLGGRSGRGRGGTGAQAHCRHTGQKRC